MTDLYKMQAIYIYTHTHIWN